MGHQRIDRYELHKVLGTGSFATVWLAHDPVVGIDVALKVLADNWARDPNMRDRFLAEARLSLTANSTRMIRVHVVNETEEGIPYIVMGYADRGTLAERMDANETNGTRFSVEEAAAVGQQVALAVADVHRLGHLHRDIKPENVLFQSSPDGEELVLGDFGLARAVDNTSFTMVSGSPGYVAPEQAAGMTQLSNQADLYPIGLMVAEMASGAPLTGSTTMGRAAARESLDVAGHFAAHQVDAPAGLVGLLEELLSSDPDSRPATAAEVADRLAAFGSSTATAASPAMAVAPTSSVSAAGGVGRGPVLLVGLALLALLLAVVGYLALRGDGDDDPLQAVATATPVPATPTASPTLPPTPTPIPAAENVDAGGTVSLASDVPLPPGTVVNPARSIANERLDGNVAMSVDEVVQFYVADEDWDVLGQLADGDTITLQIGRSDSAAQIVLTPTALTSGSDTTNLQIEGLPVDPAE